MLLHYLVKRLSGQLIYTPLHSYSENNIFMSVRWHLFHDFLFVYLFFIPDADVIITLLQYLFVALIIAFNYEDKRLTQH